MAENAEFQQLLSEVRAATAEIQAATRAQRESNAAERAARADDDKKLADKRRDGDYGRDWQVLQQRVDMNRTTLEDILSGVDKSNEARAVRTIIERDVIPRAREEYAAALASDDLAGDVDNLKRAQQELADTIAQFRRPEPSS